MPKPTYQATVIAEAVAVSTPYLLVDLSDTTNYKHVATSGIRLYRIDATFERVEGAWDVWLGLVLENDATDGSGRWLHVLHLETDDQTTEDHAQRQLHLDFTNMPDGYLLLRVTGGAADRTVSSTGTGNVTWLQNDAANIADATGATNKSAGAGDLFVWAEEVTDGGTLDLCVSVLYTTE